MTTSADCGCCEGQTSAAADAAPSTANRPGLPALSFRVGTHETFLDAMKARLSSTDFPALTQALRTRDSSDFAVALLDGWAVLGDILTFYQERIVNEGYLRTATERFSLVELARLVGYELRPGVAASAYLAYTLNDGADVPIAAGARVQSTPGANETPQIFETAEDLHARSDWNLLVPRLTELPTFTLDPTTQNITTVDGNNNVVPVDTIHFAGTTNNLKAGDVLLFTFDQNPTMATSVVRQIQSVNAVFKDTTKGIPADRTDVQLVPLVAAITKTAPQVPATPAGPAPAAPAPAVPNVPVPAVPRVPVPTLPTPTLPVPIGTLPTGPLAPAPGVPVIATAPVAVATAARSAGARGAATRAAAIATSSALGDLVKFLSKPPTVQPLNSARLVVNRAQIFSASSDVGPQVLSSFFPSLQNNLYLAFTTPQPVQNVFVFRQTAFLFGNNAPLKSAFEPPTSPPGPVLELADFDPNNDWTPVESPSVAFLDNAYPQLLPGDLVLIRSPSLEAPDGTAVSSFLGAAVATSVHPRSQYRVSTPTTEVQFAQAWWTAQFSTIRDAVVYTKPEKLTLARTPITDPVGTGNTIQLDKVYPGLTPGRWIIVAGDQIVSDGVTIPGAERVMIAAIDQNGLLPPAPSTSPSPSPAPSPAPAAGDVANAPRTQTPAAQAAATAAATPADPHTVLTLAGEGLAFSYVRSTLQIFGNVVLATHGDTRNEVLGAGDATQSLQTFAIKKPPLTFVPAPTATGIQTTLQVTVNDIIWKQADSLAFLGPTDRGYVVRVQDDGTTSVIFGTGAHGARLPTGVENIKATYRSGIGRPGNVRAGQLNLLQTRPLGVKDVNNPLPATGGADADTRDQARRNAPQTVTALDRLVSVADYATFARTFAGVGKATSRRLIESGRPIIHVTITGQENAPIAPDSLLLTSLKQALHDLGDPSLPIEVAISPLAFLFISAGVRIGADRVWEPVVAAIRAKLADTFSFDNRDVGQDVFLSEVITAIQTVDGVEYVDVDALAGVSQTAVAGASSLDAILGDLASAALPDPPIVRGRDDSGENVVVYLNPSLADLLILREITP
jgi:uncharacterized phage protein gp47/JayE